MVGDALLLQKAYFRTTPITAPKYSPKLISIYIIKVNSKECYCSWNCDIHVDLTRISFDRWLRASSSLSLCGSLTSSSRKMCTYKLLQVQPFIIVSQHLRITLNDEFVFPIGHVNVQSWLWNSIPSIIVYFLCTLACLLLPKTLRRYGNNWNFLPDEETD